MLTKGYEADGWLGLLLGTLMWYAFYGETLSSAAGFEDRMDALVREIGTRGRADAVVAAVAGASPPSDSALPGLRSLALRELRQRAEAAGIERDLIEDARDEDDPKAAVLALLLEHEAEDIAKGRQLAEELGKLASWACGSCARARCRPMWMTPCSRTRAMRTSRSSRSLP